MPGPENRPPWIPGKPKPPKDDRPQPSVDIERPSYKPPEDEELDTETWTDEFTDEVDTAVSIEYDDTI